MNLDPDTLDGALNQLDHDGDLFDLPDGRTLRLRIFPDTDSSIDDSPDFYGRIAPARTYGTGHAIRPDGFDGNAEKMWPPQNCDPVWWQPPKDVKRTDPNFTELRSNIADLVAFGFVGLEIQLLAPKADADVLGHRPVLAVESLWGIEAMVDRAYQRTVITELIGQIEEKGEADAG